MSFAPANSDLLSGHVAALPETAGLKTCTMPAPIWCFLRRQTRYLPPARIFWLFTRYFIWRGLPSGNAEHAGKYCRRCKYGMAQIVSRFITPFRSRNHGIDGDQITELGKKAKTIRKFGRLQVDKIFAKAAEETGSASKVLLTILKIARYRNFI